MPDPHIPVGFDDPSIPFDDATMFFDGTPGPSGLPVVTSITPTFGPDAGGTVVTITGTGFVVPAEEAPFDIGVATGAGIPSSGTPTSDVERYKAANVNVVRCSAVNWTSNNGGGVGTSYQASATRDAIDTFVKACNTAGMKLILGVSGGNNASGNGGTGMHTHTDNFATFCVNVASRYQKGSANGEIEAIEIGNEPNRAKWDRDVVAEGAGAEAAQQLVASEYARLMSLVYAGVVALGANRPLVMLGGIAGDPSSGGDWGTAGDPSTASGGMGCAEWTERLYATGGGASFPLGFAPGAGIPTNAELDAYKAVGGKSVRADFRWQELDNDQDGILDTNLSALDDVIDHCEAIDLDLWILAAGGKITDDMNDPALAAPYAKYIANLAEYVDDKPRVVGIEVGNEVDAGPWGKAQPPYGAFKGQAYAEIMIRIFNPAFEDVRSRTTRRIIFAGSTVRGEPIIHFKESHGRGDNPDPVVYVGPSDTPFPDGMRGHYDGICIHPYDERKYASKSIDPDTQNGGTWELLRVMKWLKDPVSAGGSGFNEVPDLAITEYGFPSYDAASPPADTPEIFATQAGAIADAVTTYTDLAAEHGWTIVAFHWFTFEDKDPDDWKDAHDYKKDDDYVLEGGVVYRCNTDHTSSPASRPPNAVWNVEDDKKWHWGLVQSGTPFPVPQTGGWRKPIYAAYEAATAAAGPGTSIKGNYDVWNTHRYTFNYTPQENIDANRLRGWLCSTVGDGTPNSGSEQIRKANGDGSTGPGPKKPHALTEFGIPTPFTKGAEPVATYARWITSFDSAIALYGAEAGACYFCYFTDYDKKNQSTATAPELADAENWHGLWLDDFTPKTSAYATFQAAAAPVEAAATEVRVGGTLATITSITATQIVITTPAHTAGPARVVVTTDAGSSIDAVDFLYTSDQIPGAPVVTLISPTAGYPSGGTLVTISGDEFTSATNVSFGELTATFTIVDDNTIESRSPAHPVGAVDVTVTNPTGTSAITPLDVFTYFPPRPPRLRRWTIHARDKDFVRQAEVEDFNALTFIRRWNRVGAHQLTIPVTSPAVPTLLAPQSGIIVSCDDEVVYSGPTRSKLRQDSGGNRQLVVSGVDDMFWLQARLAHPEPDQATTDVDDHYTPNVYDTRTGLASTVLSEFVKVNLGINAVARRRIPVLTVLADPLIGSAVTGNGRWQPLLDLLYLKAIESDPTVSFRILQSGAALVFSVSLPIDRSASAVFAVEAGTLGDFQYELAASNANYVYALGAGAEDQRLVREAENGTDINQWGLVEEALDRRDIGGTAILRQAAAAEVAQQAGVFRTDLQVIDTAGLEWRKGYDLGDRVSVIVDGIRITELVREIQVELGPNADSEKITPSVSSPSRKSTVRQSAMFSLVRDLDSRLRDIERLA